MSSSCSHGNFVNMEDSTGINDHSQNKKVSEKNREMIMGETEFEIEKIKTISDCVTRNIVHNLESRSFGIIIKFNLMNEFNDYSFEQREWYD